MAEVLAIVNSFRRPANTARIIHRLKQQTHPCRIAMVSHPESAPLVKCDGVEHWSFPDPGGPTCRFAPAAMELAADYLWFIDDDFLPSREACEHFVRIAETGLRFATLGVIGRNFRQVEPGRIRYIKRNIGRIDVPKPVDMTCRTHFVRTECFPSSVTIRGLIAEEIGIHAAKIHDDVMMCLSMKTSGAGDCYLLPAGHRVKDADLPDGGGGVSALPDHVEVRGKIASLMSSFGWRPIHA